MATYVFHGFDTNAWVVEGGGPYIVQGSYVMIDPEWSTSTDAYEFTITDDDTDFQGDHLNDSVGNDATQQVLVKDPSGTTLYDSTGYLENCYVLSDGNGNTVKVYSVAIGGTYIGTVADGPITPGVNWEVIEVVNVTDTNTPPYSAIEDQLYEQSAPNAMYGGAYNDSLIGGDSADTMDASGGTSNYASGGMGNDTIWGGSGSDTLLGGDGDDEIWGDNGNDSIDGGSGNDLLGGDGGDDTIYGQAGMDTIYGGAGHDYLDGGTEDDHIEGGTGDDTILGGAGNDSLSGGAGNDSIDGGAGSDTILAGGGSDTLIGGADNDYLFGEEGDDSLSGGAGDDGIWGGTGNDTIHLSDGSGSDTVHDFDMGDVNNDGLTNDQFDVTTLLDSGGAPVNFDDVVVSDDGAGNAVLTFPNGEAVTLMGVAPSQVDGRDEMHSVGIPCYADGTRILTPHGEVLIEELRAGDHICTMHHGVQPILWAGVRRLSEADLAADPRLRPLRIRDGTLGNNGDLLVSAQHAMLVPHVGPLKARMEGLARRGAGRSHGQLIRAIHLLSLGDGRVRQAQGKRGVSYHHLLMPMHAVIFANGAPGESLFPGAFAMAGFERSAKAELFSLFPALSKILNGADAAKLYGPKALPIVGPRILRKRNVPLLPPRGAGLRYTGQLGAIPALGQDQQPRPNR